ncbi:putative acylamino-acid-releasing enzyme isoform X2 [Apostichopus japonicus]|uniref:acylaminoacyl-peptidase n=1 Tax=Stichopus japonicus TaxID=307972 RepID=A0A2G8KUX9_STIJA|nr:putative acylamino-acid-releasing enzyme isoform X2 [Apostichopus japonicus]
MSSCFKYQERLAMSEDKAVSIYRELARIPSLATAQIVNTQGGSVTVSSTWSQRDLERGSIIKFTRTYLAFGTEEKVFQKVLPVPDITELHEELLSSFSACGKYKAVFRQVKNKKGEEQQYLEIWTEESKVNNVNLTAIDKHGKVNTDGEFGCLNWSSDNKRLVYIAEKKKQKTASYFGRKSEQVEEETEKDPIKGEQYLFRDDWGETLVDKFFQLSARLMLPRKLLVFWRMSQRIFHRLRSLNLFENKYIITINRKATWGPQDAGIIFSALYNEAYKLGAIYCDNRRSAIFHLSLEGKKCDLLSATDKCCRSPRCCPDQSKLVYIQNDVGGPHQHCKQLMMYDWTSQTASVIIDIVNRSKDRNSFPGLFLVNLPLRCWAGDHQTVFLDTIWHSTQVICDTSQVNASGGLDWFVLSDNKMEFTDVSWKVFSLPQSDGLDVEGIMFAPTASIGQRQQPPLIVFPHGGPHSSIVASYLVMPVFLCRLNYAVICVNYRGSTGFGQDAIFSLPGKVGTQDVGDVHLMAKHALNEGYGDPKRVMVTGGSHGGFLSLHMIGQYPEFYKVCAVRNPVCNIAAMLGYSDIPDWCFVEAGFEFTYNFVPTSDVYQGMLEKSPISHIQKVKAPTLFLIGKDDLRVPPKQGENFYKILRARNIRTRQNGYHYEAIGGIHNLTACKELMEKNPDENVFASRLCITYSTEVSV